MLIIKKHSKNEDVPNFLFYEQTHTKTSAFRQNSHPISISCIKRKFNIKRDEFIKKRVTIQLTVCGIKPACE